MAGFVVLLFFPPFFSSQKRKSLKVFSPFSLFSLSLRYRTDVSVMLLFFFPFFFSFFSFKGGFAKALGVPPLPLFFECRV